MLRFSYNASNFGSTNETAGGVRNDVSATAVIDSIEHMYNTYLLESVVNTV